MNMASKPLRFFIFIFVILLIGFYNYYSNSVFMSQEKDFEENSKVESLKIQIKKLEILKDEELKTIDSLKKDIEMLKTSKNEMVKENESFEKERERENEKREKEKRENEKRENEKRENEKRENEKRENEKRENEKRENEKRENEKRENEKRESEKREKEKVIADERDTKKLNEVKNDYNYNEIINYNKSEDGIAFEKWYQKEVKIIHTLQTPMHNREMTAVNLIKLYLKYAREPFEIVLVIDSCEDETQKVVLDYLQTVTLKDNQDLVRILALVSKKSLFETGSNNLGMRNGLGDYFTLIQDDMYMTVPGFNVYLVEPLRAFDDLVAVSGRCAHSYFTGTGNTVGRCGGHIKHPSELSPEGRCYVHIRDTANRGPLTLRADRAKILNYFDEEHFALGYDDHDFMARAYFQYQWKASARELPFDAPYEEGGTRSKKRTPEERQFITQINKKMKESFLESVKGKNLVKSYSEKRKLPGCEKEDFSRFIRDEMK